MDDYEERRQQISERMLTAKFSLWSALLTAHTVMLSVVVALLVTVKPTDAWRFKLGGFIAILSMAMLLLNFALTKSQYERIGQRLSNPGAELSESERTQDEQHALLRQRVSTLGEITAILGLGVEVVLFGWVLAASC
jgi:hypothetical protein